MISLSPDLLVVQIWKVQTWRGADHGLAYGFHRRPGFESLALDDHRATIAIELKGRRFI